jgi:hypothetical protein
MAFLKKDRKNYISPQKPHQFFCQIVYLKVFGIKTYISNKIQGRLLIESVYRTDPIASAKNRTGHQHHFLSKNYHIMYITQMGQAGSAIGNPAGDKFTYSCLPGHIIKDISYSGGNNIIRSAQITCTDGSKSSVFGKVDLSNQLITSPDGFTGFGGTGVQSVDKLRLNQNGAWMELGNKSLQNNRPDFTCPAGEALNKIGGSSDKQMGLSSLQFWCGPFTQKEAIAAAQKAAQSAILAASAAKTAADVAARAAADKAAEAVMARITAEKLAAEKAAADAAAKLVAEKAAVTNTTAARSAVEKAAADAAKLAAEKTAADKAATAAAAAASLAQTTAAASSTSASTADTAAKTAIEQAAIAASSPNAATAGVAARAAEQSAATATSAAAESTKPAIITPVGTNAPIAIGAAGGAIAGTDTTSGNTIMILLVLAFVVIMAVVIYMAVRGASQTVQKVQKA